MKQKQHLAMVPGVEAMIHLVRGQKIMLDSDLARLYGVATKNLNKAVKRNLDRFPADFMFRLDPEEVANLRFQIGTASGDQNLRFQFGTSSSHGGQRYRPYAFTQEGVAMLSGVLNSPRAVQVNVAVMRAFVRMRGFLLSENDLAKRLAELEKKHGSHDEAIQEIFLVIKKLITPPRSRRPKREIGFHTLLAEHAKPK